MVEDGLQDRGREERVAVEGDVEEEPAAGAADELGPVPPCTQCLPQCLPRAKGAGALRWCGRGSGRLEEEQQRSRQRPDAQEQPPGDARQPLAGGRALLVGAEAVEQRHAHEGHQERADALHGEDHGDAAAAAPVLGALRGDGRGERVDAAHADAQHEPGDDQEGEDGAGVVGIQGHRQGGRQRAQEGEDHREPQGTASA
mmetsp:Transcript_42308/g.134422  ORF Transcript_42308/g.134422 Transcript_42308/m.134422 type:complete len:200 (+) Transcript_42308:587-1186(+)